MTIHPQATLAMRLPVGNLVQWPSTHRRFWPCVYPQVTQYSDHSPDALYKYFSSIAPFPCLPSLLELIISQIVRHLGDFDDWYYLGDIVEGQVVLVVRFFFNRKQSKYSSGIRYSKGEVASTHQVSLVRWLSSKRCLFVENWSSVLLGCFSSLQLPLAYKDLYLLFQIITLFRSVQWG